MKISNKLILGFLTISCVVAKSLAVFIDELDTILRWDSIRDFELLNLLREISEIENCRFFFGSWSSLFLFSHPLGQRPKPNGRNAKSPAFSILHVFLPRNCQLIKNIS